MQKPSAKNIVSIAVAAIIIGAAFAASRHEKTPSVAANGMQLPMVATTTSGDIAYSDNWEKTLSTAVGGWSASTTTATANISGQNLSPTDQFGRDIFARYIQAQNSGADLSDPNVQQGVVDQVLADGTVIPSPKVYTKNNIMVETGNGTAAMVSYGTAIGTIFLEDQSTSTNSETAIMQDSLNANDPSILKKLDPFISSYQKIVKDLVATPVPSNMTSLHISLINAISELLFADQSFEKAYTDALTSLAGVSAYKQGAQDLPNALLAIKEYFVLNGVTFDPAGGGSIFNVQK